MWAVIAALALGGCLCSDTRTTEAGFAPMESYRPEIAACIAGHACGALCTDLFQLDGDAEVERCTITTLVRPDSTVQTGPFGAGTDLRQFRGANVRVTYVTHDSCDDSWIDGDDGSTDDGSTDDGSTDDGSDDGSTDDGSTDGGSTDDGSTDDGSTDDGSGDGSSSLR